MGPSSVLERAMLFRSAAISSERSSPASSPKRPSAANTPRPGPLSPAQGRVIRVCGLGFRGQSAPAVQTRLPRARCRLLRAERALSKDTRKAQEDHFRWRTCSSHWYKKELLFQCRGQCHICAPRLPSMYSRVPCKAWAPALKTIPQCSGLWRAVESYQQIHSHLVPRP